MRVLRQSTAAALRPLIAATPPVGRTLNPDEGRGYAGVAASGRGPQTVNPSSGQREWARDDDGDGVREGPRNPIEGWWPGLHHHRRPLRGVNKWFLRGYGAVFEGTHNRKAVTSEVVARMIVLSP